VTGVKGITEEGSSPAERLLGAAAELFYREGIRAVGVDTVVDRAGVAKMTLYNNFGSKDELVAAYLRARDERWRAWLEEASEGRSTPQERLLAVFDALESWIEGEGGDFRGCAFINATTEIADPNHPARVVAREHKEWMREHFVKLASEAGARDPEELADQFVILFEGAIVTAVTRGDTEPTRKARAAAESLLAAGAGDAGERVE
jgi:AcrR family transcriptional regulator